MVFTIVAFGEFRNPGNIVAIKTYSIFVGKNLSELIRGALIWNEVISWIHQKGHDFFVSEHKIISLSLIIPSYDSANKNFVSLSILEFPLMKYYITCTSTILWLNFLMEEM